MPASKEQTQAAYKKLKNAMVLLQSEIDPYRVVSLLGVIHTTLSDLSDANHSYFPEESGSKYSSESIANLIKKLKELTQKYNKAEMIDLLNNDKQRFSTLAKTLPKETNEILLNYMSPPSSPRQVTPPPGRQRAASTGSIYQNMPPQQDPKRRKTSTPTPTVTPRTNVRASVPSDVYGYMPRRSEAAPTAASTTSSNVYQQLPLRQNVTSSANYGNTNLVLVIPPASPVAIPQPLTVVASAVRQYGEVNNTNMYQQLPLKPRVNQSSVYNNIGLILPPQIPTSSGRPATPPPPVPPRASSLEKDKTSPVVAPPKPGVGRILPKTMFFTPPSQNNDPQNLKRQSATPPPKPPRPKKPNS